MHCVLLTNLAQQGVPVLDVALDAVRRALDLEVQQDDAECRDAQRLSGLVEARNCHVLEVEGPKHLDEILHGRLVVFDNKRAVPVRHGRAIGGLAT